jgi:hypothetical protein
LFDLDIGRQIIEDRGGERLTNRPFSAATRPIDKEANVRYIQKIYLWLQQTGSKILKWRAAHAAKGLEGIPGLALFVLLFCFSLCVSLSGVLLREAWYPLEQLLKLWAILPMKIRLAVCLMGVSLSCVFALVVYFTPIIAELSSEVRRRFRSKPGST